MAQSPAELLAASAWKLHQSGRLEEAIELYRRAAALAPAYAEIHNNLGNALRAAGRPAEAVASLRRAAKLKPSIATVHTNLGLALGELGQLEEALMSHRRAIKLHPRLALAHYNLGVALVEGESFEDAVTSYRRAIELDPGLREAHANLALALGRLSRPQDAVLSFRRAIELKPDDAETHAGLGGALRKLNRYDEAAASFRRAVELKPDYRQPCAHYIFMQQIMCDWRDPRPAEQTFTEIARSDEKGSLAFYFLTIADDPAAQLQMARHDIRTLGGTGARALWQGQRYQHAKIRLAYLSSDYHEHATAYLMAELFERHDRSRFEISAYSFGPDDASPMRRRLVKAFDRFIDVGRVPDREVAEEIRKAEIDIVIDLKGHTENARPRIFGYRPAPIQVNYLGYPGTTGADFMDYIVVNSFVVPPVQQPNFTEKLVHLPDSYQVNDRHRAIAAQTPSRMACGLPQEGFVFCSFNNSYKLTPAFFDIWMRLLKAVPGSVLWLLGDNEWAMTNLRREAAACGVSNERLVFAPRTNLAEHLSRQRAADLFLDTLPVNAHTTASDALWAGLPVLTCAGTGFAARVAGSLLNAVGLPELVTISLEEYEHLALRLATQPAELARLRQKLAQNRLTTPLFDTERYRRHIEAAYLEMWSNWQRGEKPRAFSVTPVGEPAN